MPLFVRRARALPISIRSGARRDPRGGMDARPRRNSRSVRARAGAIAVLSLVAAAAVLCVVAASALTTHERGARGILADEGDASVPLGAAWTSYEPPICEPGAEEPGSDDACVAVPASLLVASSDGIPRACVEPLEPAPHADDFALTCRREPEMSSP